MSPLFKVKPKADGWLVIDALEDDELAAVIVIPLFGPDHHGGADCWCQPTVECDGANIVHNAQH